MNDCRMTAPAAAVRPVPARALPGPLLLSNRRARTGFGRGAFRHRKSLYYNSLACSIEARIYGMEPALHSSGVPRLGIGEQHASQMPTLHSNWRARTQRLLRRLGRLLGVRAALRVARVASRAGAVNRPTPERAQSDPGDRISDPLRELKIALTWRSAALLPAVAVLLPTRPPQHPHRDCLPYETRLTSGT